MGRILCGFGTRRALAGALLTAALMLSPAPLRADPMTDGLVRLAEILGAAHHLRGICSAGEGSLWRNKMLDLLEVAGAEPQRRQALIAHFNDGYHHALAKFPDCTSVAATEATALLDEGRRLAASLAGMDQRASAF